MLILGRWKAMPILERYRGRGRREAFPGRRLWSLAALLCLLVLAIAAATQRHGQPESVRAAPARREAAATPAPLPDEPAPPADAPPLEDWEPLPPEEERELLARIIDQAPLGVLEHAEAYYYLLNKVRRMSPEEMEARLDDAVRYEDYDLQAHIIRGAVVETRGIVLRLEETPVNPAKAGAPAVWEGQLLDRQNRLYSFALTDAPRPPLHVGLRMRDRLWVRLRGVFMQVIVFENRETPPNLVATPFIIARELHPVEVGTFSPTFTLSWPWFAVMVLAAVALALRMSVGLFRPPRRRG